MGEAVELADTASFRDGSFLSDVLACTAAGATLSLASTATRWFTWTPYDPLLIPYDLLVLAAAGTLLGVAVACLRRVGARVGGGSDLAARLLLELAVVGFPIYTWLAAFFGSGGGGLLKVLTAALLLMAAATGAVHAFKGAERRGLPVAWLGFGCAASMALSVFAFPIQTAFSLVFPAVLIALVAPGLSVARASLRDAGVPMGLALLAALGLTSQPAPGSTPPAREPAAAVNAERPTPGLRPSVLLVVVDTLRQDHLPLYGYARPITPELDRWAADARVFDGMTTNGSWTLPSHASLFTGLSLRTHGVHGFRGGDRPAGNAHPLAPEFDTLAEVLERNGWATGAVLANAAFLDPRYQIDQGFETYWTWKTRRGFELAPADALARWLQPWRYQEFEWEYVRDRYITDGALEWLDSVGEQPYFLFVNYLDVHDPSARAPTRAVPLEDETPWTVHHYQWWPYVAGESPLDEAMLRDVVNNYDRELEHLDRELVRLLDYVDRNASPAGTYVIVTSDHGEYFGEHGLTRHSISVHDVVTRVPLLVKGPDVPPGRSHKSVQLSDVFPQVLSWLDLEAEHPVEGTDLLSEEEHEVVAEWYPAHRRYELREKFKGRFDRTIRSLRDGEWEILADDRGGLELYDLSQRPWQRRDLREVEPARVAALKARLDEWIAAHPETEPTEKARPLSAEDLERLRALGYVD